MQPAEVRFAGQVMLLDPSGAVVWPERSTLIVADLHLEHGAALARRGTFLPPYDTDATLARLAAVIARHRPHRVVSLGDSFHDRSGAASLAPPLEARLRALVDAVEWLWVEGNHDGGSAQSLGGTTLAEAELDGIVLRHDARPGGAPQIIGHLHPKARFRAGLRRLRLDCFVHDARTLLLPAFGALTGGLNVLDPAVAGLFDRGPAIYVLGERRSWRVPRSRLEPDCGGRP